MVAHDGSEPVSAAAKLWLTGLPWKLIGILSAVLLMLGLVLAVYHAGAQSARADAAEAQAKLNAAAAAIYRRNVEIANTATAHERAKAEAAQADNAKLKEIISNAAKGSASPGVLAAMRGVRLIPAAAKPAVPGS
jgi:hypothetical protein